MASPTAAFSNCKTEPTLTVFNNVLLQLSIGAIAASFFPLGVGCCYCLALFWASNRRMSANQSFSLLLLFCAVSMTDAVASNLYL
jgi:hypothetical protein